MTPQWPNNPNIPDCPEEPALEYAIKGTTAENTRLKEELITFKESHEELHSKFHDCVNENTRLKALVREAIKGWDRALGWGGKKYLPEYKQFINRPEVRAIMEGKDG